MPPPAMSHAPLPPPRHWDGRGDGDGYKDTGDADEEQPTMINATTITSAADVLPPPPLVRIRKAAATVADSDGEGSAAVIPLHVVTPANGQPPLHFVWDAHLARALRQKHRLLGDLVGTMPKHVSQNQFLALPLALSPEEARRALADPAVHAVAVRDGPADYRAAPPPALVRDFLRSRRDDIHRQADAAVERDAAERAKRAAALSELQEDGDADAAMLPTENDRPDGADGEDECRTDGAGADGEGGGDEDAKQMSQKKKNRFSRKQAKRAEKNARREERKAAARAANVAASAVAATAAPSGNPHNTPASGQRTLKRKQPSSPVAEHNIAERNGEADERPTKRTRVGFLERLSNGVSWALLSVATTLGLIEYPVHAAPMDNDSHSNYATGTKLEGFNNNQVDNGIDGRAADGGPNRTAVTVVDSFEEDEVAVLDEKPGSSAKTKPESDGRTLKAKSDLSSENGKVVSHDADAEWDAQVQYDGDGENEDGDDGDGEESQGKSLARKAWEQGRASAMIVQSTTAREDELRLTCRTAVPLSRARRPPSSTATTPACTASGSSTAATASKKAVAIANTITKTETGTKEERRHARAKQAVFDDLHKRGYTMSGGSKFGADFLAYAADPQLVHAALSVVVADAEELISARDIVALGRLGDSTRKRCVLAWPRWRPRGAAASHERPGDREGADESEDEECVGVEYLGIQWDETLP